MSSRRALAFTLLEVIAVVLMLGMVFLVMGGVFSRIAATTLDANQTESTRRGLLLLDRVARDLAGATLIEKAEGVDPLAHPWLFLAESRRGSDGADRLKFDSRSARVTGEHATDLAVIAYFVERGDGDDLRLVRWSSPALPESLDRDFPRSDDPRSQIVASGLARFGVRFSGEDGELVTSWDSSTLELSGKLPLSAEITLALLDATAAEGERVFSRRVLLPLRPFNLEKTLAGEDGEDEDEDEDEDDDEECVTAAECQASNPSGVAALLAQLPDPAAGQAQINANPDMCVEDIEASLGIDLSGVCE